MGEIRLLYGFEDREPGDVSDPEDDPKSIIPPACLATAV